MKTLLFVILSVISVQVFAENNFSINGTLPNENLDGKTVYLKKYDNTVGFITLDSAFVVKNTFNFKGASTDIPKLAFIMFGQPADIATVSVVILEKGAITLTLEKPSKVGGTPNNDKFQAFRDQQDIIFYQINQLSSENDNVNERYSKLVEKLKLSTYNYLKENMSNEIGEFFITEAQKVLDAPQTIELIKSSRPEFQKNPEIQFLVQELTSGQPSIGDAYMDVKLKNLDGKDVSLSDYIGGKNKYVLIDFWASWCGPCIKETPTLIEAYSKYKDKGFEIVGISLDNNQRYWENNVEKLNITWPQMSDLGGWKSKAARLYKVKSIPLTFLVDAEGKIVAKNLRGENLLNELKEIFY